MSESEQKTRVNITITESSLEVLKEYAEERGMSPTGLASLIVTNWCRDEPRKEKLRLMMDVLMEGGDGTDNQKEN